MANGNYIDVFFWGGLSKSESSVALRCNTVYKQNLYYDFDEFSRSVALVL